MRKSAFIISDPIFGPVQKVPHAGTSKRTIMLNEAQCSYRKLGEQSIFEQEFKGRYGYLHHVELVLSQELRITIAIKLRDLYGIYFLQGNRTIKLENSEGDLLFTLSPQKAIYLYLPVGTYQLLVNPGTYQIFSFYFDIGFLDGLPKQDLEFLGKLRDAHKTNSEKPLQSVEFRAGTLTTAFIKKLGRYLTKGEWNSQLYVLDQLQLLLQISKSKIDKQKLLHQERDISGELVMKMIENGVDQKGMQFNVKSLQKDIPLSIQQLNKLFKAKYRLTLTAYKKKYIIKKSIPLLLQRTPIIRICEILSIKDDRVFYRMFRSITGTTPRAYVAREYRK